MATGRPDRKEEQVRRLLDGPHPHVPPELAELAAAQGGRLLRRRRALRRLVLTVAVFGVAAFTLWAIATRPWDVQPAPVTPPVYGW